MTEDMTALVADARRSIARANEATDDINAWLAGFKYTLLPVNPETFQVPVGRLRVLGRCECGVCGGYDEEL
jgi:hypothetical protein